jgi:hypothetical protein
MSVVKILDSIHYDIESTGNEETIQEIENKIKDLKHHLKNQRKRIKKIKSFDCDKVKELPSEIVKHIESFMYDDIDTIQKAWCIRCFYLSAYDTHINGHIKLNLQQQYIYHIFKKYDRKKLRKFIMKHRLLLQDDYPINKTTPKYELVKYIHKALQIEDFNWYGKGLLYQTKYNYVFKIFDENTFGNRVLDIQYRTYQILKIVSTSPQPLT